MCRGLAILAALALAGCSTSSDAPSGKVRVFAGIQPQAYFVERVGGPHVEVGVMVGPGQSPHVFEPTPKQVAALARAQVYFSVGMPFEARILEKAVAMNKGMEVVDTRQGIKLRLMTERDEHEGEGHGAEGARDPHIWLDPRLVKVQAATICRGLCEVDPAHAAEYEKNLKEFQADLDRVDARIAKVLAPLKGKEFMVFHPAFGYFADAYGLKQVPVELEGKEPSAKQLAELIARAKEKGVKVIFVQPQLARKSAEAVASAIGGAVVPMDDLARDYLKNLEDMAEKIDKALAAGG